MSNEEIPDATIRMEKRDDRLTIVMQSPTVNITLTTTGDETPEHLEDMISEFPDAVVTVINKAMEEADDEPT